MCSIIIIFIFLGVYGKFLSVLLETTAILTSLYRMLNKNNRNRETLDYSKLSGGWKKEHLCGYFQEFNSEIEKHGVIHQKYSMLWVGGRLHLSLPPFCNGNYRLARNNKIITAWNSNSKLCFYFTTVQTFHHIKNYIRNYSQNYDTSS